MKKNLTVRSATQRNTSDLVGRSHVTIPSDRLETCIHTERELGTSLRTRQQIDCLTLGLNFCPHSVGMIAATVGRKRWPSPALSSGGGRFRIGRQCPARRGQPSKGGKLGIAHVPFTQRGGFRLPLNCPNFLQILIFAKEFIDTVRFAGKFASITRERGLPVMQPGCRLLLACPIGGFWGLSAAIGCPDRYLAIFLDHSASSPVHLLRGVS